MREVPRMSALTPSSPRTSRSRGLQAPRSPANFSNEVASAWVGETNLVLWTNFRQNAVTPCQAPEPCDTTFGHGQFSKEPLSCHIIAHFRVVSHIGAGAR